MDTIIVSGGLLVGLGLLSGLSLAYASKHFHVKVDERAKKVEDALPGFNCAACGQTGCRAFAEAVLDGKVAHHACAPGGGKTHAKVADILGVQVPEVEIMKATVYCGGGDKCKDKYEYKGVKSCAQAALVSGGPKACGYGCIGFGDCIAACRFGALFMGDKGLPVVDREKCRACGLCAKACPKHIIELTPEDKRFHVLCKSKDKGPVVRKACEAGCIGCGLCVRNCPNQACHMEDNLSRIEYPKCDNTGVCAENCPTKCIQIL